MKAEIKSVKIYQVTCPECGHVHNLSHNEFYAIICQGCKIELHKNHEDEIKADKALQSVINAVQSGVPLKPQKLVFDSNGALLEGSELEACEYEELSHLAISKATIELVVKTLKDMLS